MLNCTGMLNIERQSICGQCYFQKFRQLIESHSIVTNLPKSGISNTHYLTISRNQLFHSHEFTLELA